MLNYIHSDTVTYDTRPEDIFLSPATRSVGSGTSLREIKTEFPTIPTRFEDERVVWNQYTWLLQK